MVYIILIISAYLLGSIPSSVWIGKAFYDIDPREHGSKNAGATNTLRVMGAKAALFVFIIDMLKGFIAVNLIHFSGLDQTSDQALNLKLILTATAIIGHIFPIFAGFRGGKGVATLAGCIIAVFPLAALCCLVIFFTLLAITKYVSVSSMTAGICFPFLTIFAFGQTYTPFVIFSIVIPILLIITHRKNIARLRAGTENKTYLTKNKNKC